MRITTLFLFSTLIGCTAAPLKNAGSDHNYYCARYLAAGELERARNRCEMALEFGDGYAEPYNLIGQIELADGYLEEAEAAFKQAIALKEDFAEAYNNLGALKQMQGNRQAARDLFQQAIEVDPDYQVARLNLGVIQHRTGDLSAARSTFGKCLENDPSQCECLLGMGAVTAEQGQLPRARVQFERATRICGENPEAPRSLCWATLQLGELGVAQASCARALAIDPEHLEARALYDTVRTRLAKREALLRSYAENARATPQDPEPRFRLCLAHEKFGQLVEATDWCDRAIALSPGHAAAHFHAARIAERRNDAAKTGTHCRQVLRLKQAEESARRWCTSRLRELGG